MELFPNRRSCHTINLARIIRPHHFNPNYSFGQWGFNLLQGGLSNQSIRCTTDRNQIKTARAAQRETVGRKRPNKPRDAVWRLAETVHRRDQATIVRSEACLKHNGAFNALATWLHCAQHTKQDIERDKRRDMENGSSLDLDL
jgi:hypothetical protein